jgi:hypothetical protein
MDDNLPSIILLDDAHAKILYILNSASSSASKQSQGDAAASSYHSAATHT